MRSHNPFLAYLIVALFAFASCLSGFSQRYVIKNYTTNDGLPSNLIHKCIQDKNGFLWIATANGLSRFDGQKFTNYGPRDGILGNEVISVSLLNDGIIGFYINGCFIKNKNGFINLKNHPLNNIDASHHVYSDVIDSFLIISHSYAIYYFNKNTLQLVRSERGYKLMAQKCSDGTIKSIEPSSVFKPLIKTYDSLDIYRWRPTINKEQDVLFYSPNSGWICIYDRSTSKAYQLYDAKRNIINCYLSTDSTLYLCDQNGLSSVHLNTQKEEAIINGISFNSVTEDNEGTIWACTTTDGIFSIRKNSKLQFKKPFQDGFPVANTFLKTSANNFILGTKTNSFIRYSPLDGNTITTLPKGINNRIISIVPFKEKQYFFSDKYVTDEKGEFYDSLYCTKYVSCYANDSFVISNCFETILFSFNAHQQLSMLLNGRSFSNLVTRSKEIYIGSISGLYFKANLNSANQLIELEKDKVVKAISIKEDSKGRVWVGTDGWGIFVLNRDHTILTKINKENILESDNIHTLIVDHDDKVWVGTDKGILLIQETRASVFNASKPFSDVKLQNKEVNSIVVEQDSVYFITAKEFVACTYQKNVPSKNIVVNISKVTSNDSLFALSTLSFAPTQNNIKVHLECPLINNEDKAIYYFALLTDQQNDTVWHTTTNEILEFNALNPGTYTLIVKAQDAPISANKSNMISWHFTIQQYFYKTWTFGFLLESLVFIGVLVAFQYNSAKKQNRLRKELEAESKINELKLQSLLSQMNPHFLFNSLNVIQKFITSNDDVNALNQLSDFSDLMRESLNHSRKGSINLEEEILFLEQYVKLEKKRFDNEFDFFIHNEIDEDLGDISIPPMLIQPLIENAIKHGVSNMKNPKGEIHTTFRLSHHTLLEIIVSDNGSQRSTLRSSKKKRESHALNIIKERVALIKNEKGAGSFELTINEVGAIACLKIPIV